MSSIEVKYFFLNNKKKRRRRRTSFVSSFLRNRRKSSNDVKHVSFVCSLILFSLLLQIRINISRKYRSTNKKSKESAKSDANMPMEFLDRVPVPNLRLYTTISIAVLSCSVYYAVLAVKDPAWRTNHTNIVSGIDIVIKNSTMTNPKTFGTHFKEIMAFMVQDPGCIWVSLLIVYICVYVCSFIICLFINQWDRMMIDISLFVVNSLMKISKIKQFCYSN